MFFFMCSKHKTGASNEHHHIWSIHTRETEMRSKVGHLSQVNVIYALRDCCLTFRRRKKIIEKPENITVLLFRFSSCKHRALEYKQMYARAKTNAWIIIICLIYRKIYGCNGYGLSRGKHFEIRTNFPFASRQTAFRTHFENRMHWKWSHWNVFVTSFKSWLECSRFFFISKRCLLMMCWVTGSSILASSCFDVYIAMFLFKQILQTKCIRCACYWCTQIYSNQIWVNCTYNHYSRQPIDRIDLYFSCFASFFDFMLIDFTILRTETHIWV